MTPSNVPRRAAAALRGRPRPPQLARRLTAAALAALRLRNELVAAHLDLVARLAAKLARPGRGDRDDLYQAGCAALIRAAIRWHRPRPPAGRFAAYAQACILRAMRWERTRRPAIGPTERDFKRRAAPPRPLSQAQGARALRRLAAPEPSPAGEDRAALAAALDNLEPFAQWVVRCRYPASGQPAAYAALGRRAGCPAAFIRQVERDGLARLRLLLLPEEARA